MGEALQMITLQPHQIEYKTLTHCIARLINSHPEYMGCEFDEYLYEEVCREWQSRPKMDTVIRTARIIRKRRSCKTTKVDNGG